MSGAGATLQNYNGELVKSIEDLREKREELNRQIMKEEEDKGKIQKELSLLTDRAGGLPFHRVGSWIELGFNFLSAASHRASLLQYHPVRSKTIQGHRGSSEAVRDNPGVLDHPGFPRIHS